MRVLPFVRNSVLLLCGFFLQTFSVYAQNMVWFDGVVSLAAGTIDGYIVPTMAVLSVIVFLWGAFLFVFHAGDEKLRTEGKQRMVWGVIGLFVFVAVWGIVALITEFLGIAPTVGVLKPGFCVGTVCP